MICVVRSSRYSWKKAAVSAIVGGLTCVRFVRPTHSASRPVCMAGLLSVFLADVSTSLVSIVSTILLLDLVRPPLFPRNDWRTWNEPTSRNTLIALVSLEIVHHLFAHSLIRRWVEGE